MTETQTSEEKIHVIRRVEDYGVVASVTPPTTKPVEWFEEHERSQYPGRALKPSRSYEPWVFGVLERMAQSQNMTIDQAINQADARKEAQGHEGDLFVWRFDANACDQYWVAAHSKEEAEAYLRERRPDAKVYAVEQEANLEAGGFVHGDPEDGEEAEPCTFRELVQLELAVRMEEGPHKPFLVAEMEM